MTKANQSPFPFALFTVHAVLDDIRCGNLVLIGDSDRTACFEEYARVRLAHDDDVVAWLISQGYVAPRPYTDSVPVRLDGEPTPVTDLTLTGTGRLLLKFCQEA